MKLNGTNERTEMSQRVTIIGPNLRDQSKGDFHVHAEGCGDIARDPKRYGYASASPHWTIEAGSRVDVAEAVYSDIMAENGDETGEAYVDDFHFAPCVHLS